MSNHGHSHEHAIGPICGWLQRQHQQECEHWQVESYSRSLELYDEVPRFDWDRCLELGGYVPDAMASPIAWGLVEWCLTNAIKGIQ